MNEAMQTRPTTFEQHPCKTCGATDKLISSLPKGTHCPECKNCGGPMTDRGVQALQYCQNLRKQAPEGLKKGKLRDFQTACFLKALEFQDSLPE